MLYRSSFVAGFAVVSSLLVSGSAHALRSPVEVTACGQEIRSGHTGYLTADLTCPTSEGSIGVRLKNGAKLDLRGFTLTGGAAAVACGRVADVDIAVLPTKGGKCEVFGGAIAGARYAAIVGRNVTVRDVTFTDIRALAILSLRKAFVFESHFVGDGESDIQADALVEVHGSTLEGTVVNSGGKAVIESSSITGNLRDGVLGSLVQLIGSSVTGNGTESTCGQVNHACADILSVRQPVVDATSTCGLSAKLPIPGGQLQIPWGVCTND